MNIDIQLTQVSKGFDGNRFWAQARAGVIPGNKDKQPTVVLTAQPALRTGSDVYFALSEWRTDNLGESWEGPIEHSDTLGRRQAADGSIIGICDMTPSWHAATQTLLSTGHTVFYQNDKHPILAHQNFVAYSTYAPDSRTWQPWQTLTLPDHPKFGKAGAGCTQRLDLDDGTILLPIYFRPISNDWNTCAASTVLRCEFDGSEMKYLEHGTELTVQEPRGLGEPSLTRYKDNYFLTLRNDIRGYVTSSKDGLHFAPPKPWCFDDGEELGNYNTQQHWVTHSKGLFLVYTRRGLSNDHVFRHRAPLMLAEVDPDKLVVIRKTERELVPNRGARLGNFSVCNVNQDETWISVSEWMQPDNCEQYGSDNTIWVARIKWSEPNNLI